MQTNGARSPRLYINVPWQILQLSRICLSLERQEKLAETKLASALDLTRNIHSPFIVNFI